MRCDVTRRKTQPLSSCRRWLMIVQVTWLVGGLTGCDQLTEKGGTTLHKAGETVGRSATVLVDGIGEGIKGADKRQLVLGDKLQQRGLRTGKFFVDKAEEAEGDNRLTVYCIFERDFSRAVTATLFDEAGQEYGRKRITLSGKAGDARNVDFVFEPRTDIERGTKIVLD